MAQTNPYRLTDKTTELLDARAVKRFNEAKDKVAAKGFDELNVINEVKMLYENLRRDNEELFTELAQMRYEECDPSGDFPPDYLWLAALLLAYDPVTKYVYENEVERKRDRLAEAINASSAKSEEFLKGLGLWTQMTEQYADTITDKASLKAYKDAGVTHVEWVAEMDDRTCKTCKERDGKIYPIDNVPPKTHWRCRCWLKPIIE